MTLLSSASQQGSGTVDRETITYRGSPLPSIDSVICSRLFSCLSPSMPRPRYRITVADVRVVHRWIRERLRNDAWPEDWPRLTAWDKFPYEKPTEKTLQRWCDRLLDT